MARQQASQQCSRWQQQQFTITINQHMQRAEPWPRTSALQCSQLGLLCPLIAVTDPIAVSNISHSTVWLTYPVVRHQAAFSDVEGGSKMVYTFVTIHSS